jgi:hypothetical protein
MVTSNDYNVFGIHNPAERYSWSAYHLLVLLSSLIGDTLILYVSFRRPDAFKINKFLVAIIQHIAISDLAQTSSVALPRLISLLEGRWILGDALCYAKVYVNYTVYPTNTLFVAVLTLSKYVILKHPLRSSACTRKRAHQLCVSIWVSCVAVPVTFLTLGKDDVLFDYRVYECDYGFRAEAWKIMIPLLSIIFQLAPTLIIVGVTIPTLRYLINARKSSKRFRVNSVNGAPSTQGTLTVGLTAIVFCLSNLPLLVYFIGKNFVTESPSSPFHVHFRRVAYFMALLNTMANFYIYTLTIRSFREFVLSLILSVSEIFQRDLVQATYTGKH